MSRYHINRVIHLLLVFLIVSCAGNQSESTSDQSNDQSLDTIASNSFIFEVRAVTPNPSLPALHSFAWARSGNNLIIIGGRTGGFHGLSETDTPFSVTSANKIIYLVDFSDFSTYSLPLNPSDPDLLQFSSSNMEFCQSGDNLFLVGGFGRSGVTDRQNDFTFDRLVALSISSLIQEVKKGSLGNPKKAINYTISSPYFKVSGGEMAKFQNYFYLMFGQNYPGIYTLSRTGNYTTSIRRFAISGGILFDTLTYSDTSLHRRDLNVMEVIQPKQQFYVGYGGAFTNNDGGYLHPVRVYPNDGDVFTRMDTLKQLTNNYACARASLYDPASGTNIHVLFGGIGAYMYDAEKQKLVDGDNGAKLPFVNTITQMKWQNYQVSQHIQTPPEPLMPALVGANAIFIANPSLLYQNNVIDMRKLTPGTGIGYIYGGIKSIKPTSSDIYPTSANGVLYEVFVN